MRDAIAAGLIGQLVTPESANRVVPGATWALDNGCFSGSWTFEKWQTALDRDRDTPGCLFAVVPDVVGDAAATDVLWRRWAPAVSRRGYRCAYVAQDGCRRIPAGAEWVFIGGSTGWKLGPEMQRIVRDVKESGRRVHMGRVNSLRRIRLAADMGCDTADGTCLTFGPETNLPRVLGWCHPRQPGLFGGVG